MSLRDKILKNTTVDLTDTLIQSKLFKMKDMIPTPVPIINVGLSGTVRGGVVPGTTMLAGPSKHFKSGFALLLAASFLRKYPDGVILFYDSEFGSPQSYFESFGIDPAKVVHTPVTSLEDLRHDIVNQLQGIERGEHVMILIDSIGNLASKKETEDAIEGKSAADFTRAKTIKSLFRLVTPHLTLKNIPLIAINHTYMTMEMYSKPVVSGGTGSYYGADNIWIVGRQQDKDSEGLNGYNFVINIEKSRYVKEKSKFVVNVSFDNGINRWSNLFDIALEHGFIVSEKRGWFNVVDSETGELIEPAKRRGDLEFNSTFWEGMLQNEKFVKKIEDLYRLDGIILGDDDARTPESADVMED